MNHLLIFGLGYSAQAIAQKFRAAGWSVDATGSAGNLPFEDDAAVRAALARATAVLSSVPPVEGLDPVLARYGDALAGRWLGYLSSTGVYGDCGGAWVDESGPVGGGRRSARAQADAAWLALGARVLRLPGIYGPGRSAFDRLRAKAAHRIIMSEALANQIFSRIHVADIASATLAALNAPAGAYNIADNLPAPQNSVIEEACQLSGLPLPPLLSLDEAALSPAARAFYAENRRVANGKARRVLGWQPQFPTFREGLRQIWDLEKE